MKFKDLKSLAKSDLREHWGKSFGLIALPELLINVLAIVGLGAVLVPILSTFVLSIGTAVSASNVDINETLQRVIGNYGTLAVVIGLIVYIIGLILLSFIQISGEWGYLDTVNEREDLGEADVGSAWFKIFKQKFGRTLWLLILITLIVYVVELIFQLAIMGVTALGYGIDSSATGTIIFGVIMLIYIFALIYVTLGLTLAQYERNERPELTAVEAIKASFRDIKHHRWQAIGWALSFIPWILIYLIPATVFIVIAYNKLLTTTWAIIVLGLVILLTLIFVGFWLIPYIKMATLRYYNWLIHKDDEPSTLTFDGKGDVIATALTGGALAGVKLNEDNLKDSMEDSLVDDDDIDGKDDDDLALDDDDIDGKDDDDLALDDDDIDGKDDDDLSLNDDDIDGKDADDDLNLDDDDIDGKVADDLDLDDDDLSLDDDDIEDHDHKIKSTKNEVDVDGEALDDLLDGNDDDFKVKDDDGLGLNTEDFDEDDDDLDLNSDDIDVKDVDDAPKLKSHLDDDFNEDSDVKDDDDFEVEDVEDSDVKDDDSEPKLNANFNDEDDDLDLDDEDIDDSVADDLGLNDDDVVKNKVNKVKDDVITKPASKLKRKAHEIKNNFMEDDDDDLDLNDVDVKDDIDDGLDDFSNNVKDDVKGEVEDDFGLDDDDISNNIDDPVDDVKDDIDDVKTKVKSAPKDVESKVKKAVKGTKAKAKAKLGNSIDILEDAKNVDDISLDDFVDGLDSLK